MNPLTARVGDLEGRLGQDEARLQLVAGKADAALARLDDLRLERRFVLSLKDGAQFASDSATITQATRRQIDQVLNDIKTTDNTLLVVAGHTDSTGPEDYNFELGQQRATMVARYLISRKGIDPFRVMAVSYGAHAPLADNTTPAGRRKNRRIEILVYQEGITSSPKGHRLDLKPTG
jgi:outer membrane protein OmpA-like peptidoglycan-associated protein